MPRLVIAVVFGLLGAVHLALAEGRYSPEEEQALNARLHSLEGKQRECAVSFVKGYEQYTYPHCKRYNKKDKEFCAFYKEAVPTSVIETALHICRIEWSLAEG